MDNIAKQALYESVKSYIDYVCECHQGPVISGEVIASEYQAVAQVADIKREKREHFIALILDNSNRLMKKFDVSTGTANSSMVHPREAYREAVRLGATSVIFLHNHPSGSLEPSKQDIETTERLKKAGEILGIQMHDHIIVTADNYRSILSSPEWHVHNNGRN